MFVKFMYSEKAIKFGEISTVDLTVTKQDKSMVEISQKFVAFSEYMNFRSMQEKLEKNDFIKVCIEKTLKPSLSAHQ